MAETEDLIFDSNGIYIPQTWSDELVDSTAITPQRLDHIEQGIKGTSESLKEFSDSVSNFSIANLDRLRIVGYPDNPTTLLNISFVLKGGEYDGADHYDFYIKPNGISLYDHSIKATRFSIT